MDYHMIIATMSSMKYKYCEGLYARKEETLGKYKCY